MGCISLVHFLLLAAGGLQITSCSSPSYQRPVTDDELTSPITKNIDKSFYRYAEELQSDKSGRGSSYHYIYRYSDDAGLQVLSISASR